MYPRLSQHLSGARAADVSRGQNQLAVDEDVCNACRKLDWIDKCTFVEDGVGIEDYDVREVAGLEETTTLEAEDFCRLGGHLANCIFEGKGLLLTNVLAQDPRKRSEDPRVWLATEQAVGADRLDEGTVEVRDDLA